MGIFGFILVNIVNRGDESALAATGQSTIDSVTIAQAGTGQSVTIDSVTMDENTYGTNATRRTILNNNLVKYDVNLYVTEPGQLTITMTLPANNPIDPSSVSSSAGCQSGSRVERATVDGQTSIYNNRAVCVLNPATAGQLTWSVTANLWGYNGQQIQPTVTTGDGQSAQAEPITVMGKPNYRYEISISSSQTGANNGWNYNAGFSARVYIPIGETGVLGVEPLSGTYEATADTSKLPIGWQIDKVGNTALFFTGGLGNNYTARSGNVTATRVDDSELTAKSVGMLTAGLHCPTMNVNGGTVSASTRCYQGELSVKFKIPVSSLTEQNKTYSMTTGQFQTTTASGSPYSIMFSDGGDSETIYWELNNRAGNNPSSMISRYKMGGALPGWSAVWDFDGPTPFYDGQKIFVSNGNRVVSVPTSDHATNAYACHIWDSDVLELLDEATVNNLNSSDAFMGTTSVVEYGVVSGVGVGEIRATGCGKYGDTNTDDRHFFDTLAEAQAYASEHGTRVNAVRQYAPKLATTWRDVMQIRLPLRVIGSKPNSNMLGWSIMADEWPTENWVIYGSKFDHVPGLLSHDIAVDPVDSGPRMTERVIITPRTYNQDTNTKITVTLPRGMTMVDNSVQWQDHKMVQGQDYQVTRNGDGTTTVEIKTGTIGQAPTMDAAGLPVAADNDYQGVVGTPITLEAVIDDDVSVPSTLTIKSVASGDGTSLASTSFRQKSVDVSAAVAKSFNYDLTTTTPNDIVPTTSSTIYATDTINYHYRITNTMDDAATNLDVVSVLPYNDDGRGTTGLTGYAIDTDQLTEQLQELTKAGAKLYYTTDQLARQYQQSTPDQLAGEQGDINWQPSVVKDGQVELPTDSSGATTVTAIKLRLASLGSGQTIRLDLTLTDIQAAANAVLANDLTYVSVSELASGTGRNRVTTKYLGDLLGLAVDRNQLNVVMDSNDEQLGGDQLTNLLTVDVRTAKGYTLTMSGIAEGQNNGSLLVSPSGQTIPTLGKDAAIDLKRPTRGRASWAVQFTTDQSAAWHGIPAADEVPLTIYTHGSGADKRSIPITYGVSTSVNTIAGQYSGRVVYTITSNP